MKRLLNLGGGDRGMRQSATRVVERTSTPFKYCLWDGKEKGNHAKRFIES
ncbi:MAG: hypothetical protein ACKVHR_14705 [Pirellulales bacterium]